MDGQGDPPKRASSAEERTALIGRLRGASLEELRELLARWSAELLVPHLRAVVRNPHADAETLETLAGYRHLMVAYEARALVARHRRTPPAVAMRFVAGLFWRDLLEIALDVHLAGPMRRLAEKYLLERLPRLTTGERIALARRAPGEALGRLLLDGDPRVVAAALDNAQLTEERLFPLLAGARAKPRILQAIARHPRWAERYEVRLLLCRHPLTPSAAVLGFLPELRSGDLESLAHLDDAAFAVRHRARELLAQREKPPGESLPLGRLRGLS